MNDLRILLKCRFCGSVGLDRGPGCCISNELPGDVKAAGPWGTRGAGARRRMRGRFAWRDRGALCRRRRWPRSSRVSGRRGTERTANERHDPHRFRGAVGGKPRWKAAGPNPSSQTGNGAPTGRGLAPPPTGLLATELDWLMANLGLTKKKKKRKKKTMHEISLCKNSHRHQPLARAVWQARVIPRGDPARGLRSRSAGRDTWESSGLCGRCRSSHRVPGDGRLAGARGQGCASLR